MLNGVEVSQETSVVHAHDFSQLTFEPARNFHGHATFGYRVIDSHGVQQGGDASTFTIHINPVNDAPTIQPTLAIEVQEGSSTRLQGLQVNDVDAGDADISITLKVEHGLLSADSATGVTVEGSGTTELVLRGSVGALNALLSGEPGVRYSADLYPASSVQMQMETVLADNPEDPIIKVNFSTLDGTLDAVAADGLTITGNGTQALSVEGRSSTLGQYLLGQSVTRVMPIATHAMSMVVNDGGGNGMDPGLTANDASEQDVRVISLSVVPLGLSLLEPEQLDTASTHQAGPGPDGSGSAAGLAATPVDTPLVLALGDVNRITASNGGTQTELLAAAQEWSELHENLHPGGYNERHEWKEVVNWLPPAGPVAPDGTYDVAAPGLAPIGALQNRLLAQAFGERAELALEAIRLLAAAPDNRSLPVIHENGWVSTKTSSLPYTDPTDLVVTLTRADLLRLQHLGLKPANVEVVDGYLNAGQLDALQHQPGLVVVDQRRGTVWIHEETRESWLQSLADTMQATVPLQVRSDESRLLEC